MKLLATGLLLLATAFGVAANDGEPLQYEIHLKQYRFSTYYQLMSQNKPVGKIVTPKRPWNLRTNYDLYTQEGVKEANGKFAFFNPAAWSSIWGVSGADLYIVDGEGNDVGYIDGEFLTLEKAKYSFYNAKNEIVANAYLDGNRTGYTIVHPEYDTVPIALLKRHYVQGTIDYWSVSVYNTEAVDLRMIKIFSAFAVHTQDSVNKDT
jgi:hypothetical protein